MTDSYEDNFNFLKSFYPISRKIYDKLFGIALLKKIKAGERLVEIDEIPEHIYLINKGVLRSFFIMENGKEVTKTIFTPINFFASFTSLIMKQPSEFIYEALTDCNIYEIDYKAFAELCNTNNEVLKFYSRYLEFLFMAGERRFVEISSTDAKQRYLTLRKRIPEIDNLIPQYQIASYLNITPVQLSRIRSKLY